MGEWVCQFESLESQKINSDNQLWLPLNLSARITWSAIASLALLVVTNMLEKPAWKIIVIQKIATNVIHVNAYSIEPLENANLEAFAHTSIQNMML